MSEGMTVRRVVGETDSIIASVRPSKREFPDYWFSSMKRRFDLMRVHIALLDAVRDGIRPSDLVRSMSR